MASTDPTFVAEEAVAYLWERSGETDLMEEVRRRCESEDLPVLGPDSGSVLKALAAVAGTEPRVGSDRMPRALEVGCLYGYSGLWILEGFPHRGTLETVEMARDHADEAERTFERAGVATRATVHRGLALNVLPDLQGPYDLIFLDAEKAEYPEYLDHALRIAHPGTVIAADNVLWHGRVVEEPADDDPASLQGIREFTDRITTDPELATTILPVGDGLSVSVVR